MNVKTSMFGRFQETMKSFDPNHKMSISIRDRGSVTVETNVHVDEIRGFTSVDSAIEALVLPITIDDIISFYKDCRMGEDTITLLKSHLHAPSSYIDLIVNDEESCVVALEVGLNTPGIIGSLSIWDDQVKQNRGSWIIRDGSGNNVTYLSFFNDILVFGTH